MVFLKQKKPEVIGLYFNVVGTAGFEPATSWSRTRRTTKLCYVPLQTKDLARG